MIAFPRPEYPLSAAVLLIWPLICLVLFTWYPRHRAAILCFLLAVLYLPSATGVLFLGLPTLTRKIAAGLGVVFAAVILNRRPWEGARTDTMSKVAIGLIFFSDFARVLANGDPLVFINRVIPALPYHNIVTFVLDDLLLFGLPFYLGIALGMRAERFRELIETWLKLGLVYMIFAAIELRLSPQVHTWVYGYFQHSFEQMVRDGGFRPIVFMEHGLELALFTATCLLLSVVGGKLDCRVWKVKAGKWAWVFFPILLLTKSFAAIFYGLAGLTLLYLAPVNVRASAAKWIAVVVLTLPVTRILGWIPTDDLVEFVSDIDVERGKSLWFRLSNEDRLLEKVAQRTWTGWGGYERVQVFDRWGAKISTIDGSWMIEFAAGGVPRFAGVFGLLVWPIFKASRMARRLGAGEQKQMLAAFSVVTAFVVLDLVPNSFFNYLAPLLAGTLLGLTQSESYGAAPQRALARV